MKVSEDCSERNVNSAANSTGSRKSKASNLIKPSLIALAVAHSMSMSTADAATIHVGGADGVGCDLIGAIISSNTDSTSPDNNCVAGSGADTIELHEDVILTEPWAGTSRGLPLVSSVVTLNGNGHTISRDAYADNFGFIGLDNRGYIRSVNDLTLTDAAASDIDPNMTTVISGAVALDNVVLLNNSGAKLIDNQFRNDYLTITNSRIENNQGTAIFFEPGSFSYLDISNTVISNNMGRAIDLPNARRYPSVTISDSVITGNSANECAAFSAVQSTLFLNIDNTTISNNTALTKGGALCLHHTYIYEGGFGFRTEITNSTLSENSAGDDGGAIFAYSEASLSTINLLNSTVSNNSSGGLGGAISIQSSGGYYNFLLSQTRDTQVSFSTVNSTFVANSASSGGAIHTDDKGIVSLSLTNSIVAGNDANSVGSEIYNLSPSAFLIEAETISNNNVLGSSLESNFQAFNGFVPSTTDITATIDGNSPAMLDEIVRLLQDNGGVTKTHSLPAGSPAIDAADLNTCINDPVSALDQRGVARGDLGLCDIGAYEAGTTGALPGISVEAVKSSVFEGNPGDSRVLIYTFKLSSPQSENVMFDYQTMDGTAVGGVDYQTSSGRITFTPGQVSRIRAIEVIGDSDIESDETFNVMISNATNNAMLDPNQSQATATILNDDRVPSLPLISIDSPRPFVYEGGPDDNRKVVFELTLSSPQTQSVRFDFQTMDETAVGGVDYQIRSRTVTFEPGQESKYLAIEIIGDNDVEPDESFNVVLSNPTANAMINQAQSQVTGTIINEDRGASLPALSINSTRSNFNEGNSGDVRVVPFEVTLSSPVSERVTFDFQTMDVTAVAGEDYVMRSRMVTFMPGQVSVPFGISLISDEEIESDENFKVVLSNPSSNVTIDPSQSEQVATIMNDDR